MVETGRVSKHWRLLLGIGLTIWGHHWSEGLSIEAGIEVSKHCQLLFGIKILNSGVWYWGRNSLSSRSWF